jgi:hypothetical protein
VVGYYALGNEEPLDRLMRWAARGPYPECPDEVLRLAGTVLAWTLTSPNRFMRDYTPKAMRQLLASRPEVLGQLIAQFAEVDDMYVIERPAVIAHGSLLTDRDRDPDRPLRLARQIRARLLRDQIIPNVVVRDAVRGCFEWALRRGLIEQSEYHGVPLPYGSRPPDKPRTKKRLERPMTGTSATATATTSRRHMDACFFSLFDLGDFGRYLVEANLSRFTRRPLNKPIPKPRKRKLSPAQLAAFVGSLPDEQTNVPDIETLVRGLSDNQLRELLEIINPPAPRPLTSRYSPELGNAGSLSEYLAGMDA